MSEKNELDLAGIRARAEAASKGPYRAKAYVGPDGYIDSWEITSPYPIDKHPDAYRTIAQEMDQADAAHAAGMDPPTTLALVDEVERLTRERDEARFNAERFRKSMYAVEDRVHQLNAGAAEAKADAAKLRARVAELETNSGG